MNEYLITKHTTNHNWHSVSVWTELIGRKQWVRQIALPHKGDCPLGKMNASKGPQTVPTPLEVCSDNTHIPYAPWWFNNHLLLFYVISAPLLPLFLPLFLWLLVFLNISAFHICLYHQFFLLGSVLPSSFTFPSSFRLFPLTAQGGCSWQPYEAGRAGNDLS